MAKVEELKCPNCGAPLDYTGSQSPTMRCPYCETVVMIPEELRPEKPESNKKISISFAPIGGTAAVVPPSRGWGVTLAIIGVAFFVIGLIIVPIILTAGAGSAAMVLSDSLSEPGENPVPQIFLPTATPQPTITPTPAFAYPVNTFGEEGIGAGMLSDARYIAVDGNGWVYVADYQGGRVQRFDSDGKYLSQWRVGGERTIIDGLAANQAGQVFVAFDDLIARYDGGSGKILGEMRSPEGGEFGSLFAADDGRLAAVWYEGRWGLITSLQGHREDLVVFGPDGNVALQVPSFISGQTEYPALDVSLAINGAGTVYALSDSVVYQFSPSGKYINNFSIPADASDRPATVNAIAVDGQGRLYLGGENQIQVLSKDSRLLDAFPTGSYVDMFAIDRDGNLWAVARDEVIKFALRGR